MPCTTIRNPEKYHNGFNKALVHSVIHHNAVHFIDAKMTVVRHDLSSATENDDAS